MSASSQSRAPDPRPGLRPTKHVAYSVAQSVLRLGHRVDRCLALMFEELGDGPRARQALDRLNILQLSQPSLIWRERGRLAALTGDTTRALKEYGRFLTLRTDSEPGAMAEYETVQAEM